MKLWNTRTELSRILQIASGELETLALPRGGQTLIYGQRGGNLRVRALDSGVETELPVSANRLVPSPDGRTLAVLANRTTIPSPGPPAPLFPGMPPGEWRAPDPSGEGTNVQLWDIARTSLRTTLEVNVSAALDATFFPDGLTFAVAQSDNTIGLWNSQSGRSLGTCTGHKQLIHALAFTHDGRTLASASDDGTIRMWDVGSQQELLAIPHLGERMTMLLFAPDDRVLAVARTAREQSPGVGFHRTASVPERDSKYIAFRDKFNFVLIHTGAASGHESSKSVLSFLPQITTSRTPRSARIFCG